METEKAALDLSDFGGLQNMLDTQLGVSEWYLMSQTDIDAFGELTKDRDAMHMDPDWARQSSPYGGTIAYGFQTLSMMTAMINDILPRGSREAYKINYGFDRIRLVAPVHAGKRIRGKAHLKGLRPRDDNSHIVTVELTVEIENEHRPAVVCEWLFIVGNGDEKARRPDMSALTA